jgi:FkbM family methyltransferase
MAAAPPEAGAAPRPTRRERWRAQRGLLRSLLIYHAVPFKIRRLAALYRPFVGPGDLCFDIGAHVGDRTRALRRLGARVVAVEPQPACLAFLRWLYRADAAVTIVGMGVADAAGEATMLVSYATPTVSSLSPAWVEAVRAAPRFAGVVWEGRAPVALTTLDGLIDRFGVPAFCKLDVEGGEPSALAGLSRAIPAVVFEYVPAQRAAARACLGRLEQLGSYDYNWTEREIPRLRSSAWLTAGAMADLLDALPDEAHSGDVFARLRKPMAEGRMGQRDGAS